MNDVVYVGTLLKVLFLSIFLNICIAALSKRCRVLDGNCKGGFST